ncbi:MAG: head GIN domain-containing protein [Fimbriimonadaceae bacterium]
MRSALLLIACLNLAGCGIVHLNLHTQNKKGSGKIKTTTFKVGSFSKISSSISGRMNIEVGPVASVKAETDDNLVENLKVRVDGDTLHLDTKGSISYEKMVFTITVPSLTAWESSGAGDIRINNINSSEFSLDSTGAGRLVLSGKATDLNIDLSGAVNVDAKGLTAQNASIDMSGAGNVTLSASKTLNADLSGACSVKYFGNPTVTKSISGVSSVSRG